MNVKRRLLGRFLLMFSVILGYVVALAWGIDMKQPMSVWISVAIGVVIYFAGKWYLERRGMM